MRKRALGRRSSGHAGWLPGNKHTDVNVDAECPLNADVGVPRSPMILSFQRRCACPTAAQALRGRPDDWEAVRHRTRRPCKYHQNSRLRSTVRLFGQSTSGATLPMVNLYVNLTGVGFASGRVRRRMGPGTVGSGCQRAAAGSRFLHEPVGGRPSQSVGAIPATR